MSSSEFRPRSIDIMYTWSSVYITDAEVKGDIIIKKNVGGIILKERGVDEISRGTGHAVLPMPSQVHTLLSNLK